MLMTSIDRGTSWPEVFSLATTGDAASTQAGAKIFIQEWIPRYKYGSWILIHLGSWDFPLSADGIHRDMITACNPQHNRKLETCHRSLKNQITVTWSTELGSRIALSIACTLCSMKFGYQSITSSDGDRPAASTTWSFSHFQRRHTQPYCFQLTLVRSYVCTAFYTLIGKSKERKK